MTDHLATSPANDSRYPDGCETYGEAREAFYAQASPDEAAEQARAERGRR